MLPHPLACPCRPELTECVLSLPLPELAAQCDSDMACRSFIYKPEGGCLCDACSSASLLAALLCCPSHVHHLLHTHPPAPTGFFMSAQDGVGYFRRAEGSNLSRAIYNPTSILYVKEQEASSGGGSLSVGAIAGIAVGAAAVAVAAAASGWVLLRRRQRARVQAAAAEAKAAADEGAISALMAMDSIGPPASDPTNFSSTTSALVAPDSRPSTASSTHTGVARPALFLPQQPGGAAMAAGFVSGSSSPGASPNTPFAAPLPSYVIRRPTMASPFAMQQSRRALTPPFGSGPFGSGPFGSRPLPEPESESAVRTEEVSELLQHRARQDASMLTSGSGVSSGGGSSNAGRSTPSRLVSEALPSSLAGWVIPVSAITYLRRPDGSPFLLGEGARWGGGGWGDVRSRADALHSCLLPWPTLTLPCVSLPLLLLATCVEKLPPTAH